MANATSNPLGGAPVSTPPKFWTEKMVKWAIFSVLMALAPLVASALSQASRGAFPGLGSLIARGELVLVTAALCARSCGELFVGTSDAQREKKLFAGGATVFLLILAAIYFSDISSSYRTGITTMSVDNIAGTSILLYVCSLISSAACVSLSEVKA